MSKLEQEEDALPSHDSSGDWLIYNDLWLNLKWMWLVNGLCLRIILNLTVLEPVLNIKMGCRTIDGFGWFKTIVCWNRIIMNFETNLNGWYVVSIGRGCSSPKPILGFPIPYPNLVITCLVRMDSRRFLYRMKVESK